MTCAQSQNLIHPFLDGELDLVRKLEIEHHLQECTACSKTRENQMRLRHLLISSDLYRTAPAGLRERLRMEENRSEKPIEPRRRLPLRWIAVAASVVAVAMLSFILGRYVATRSEPVADDSVERQVVANHVRSLLVEHLNDVASSDRHTVKPWFKGKVDFAPIVLDFSDRAFPLVGGRLDYLDGRLVAAVIYRRRQHVINLFQWPADSVSESPFRTSERQGYHLIRWTQHGINCWAISDSDERELTEFAESVRETQR